MKPFKHKMTVLSQICKLIPRNLIPKLANAFGIDRQFRVFSPASYVLSQGFGQLTHALGLNDICDTLRNHCGLMSKIRDCVPPSRNGLSHTNRNVASELSQHREYNTQSGILQVPDCFILCYISVYMVCYIHISSLRGRESVRIYGMAMGREGELNRDKSCQGCITNRGLGVRGA